MSSPYYDPTPEITIRAAQGNLVSVWLIAKEALAVSEERKREVINEARRWTEIEDRASGYDEYYEWFDLTPLAEAARRAQHEVVKYLLEEGADPTLVGSPHHEEGSHFDAYKAADKRRAEIKDGDEVGKSRAERTIALLAAAMPFWTKASYAYDRFSKTSRKDFTNAPTDMPGLLAELKRFQPLGEEQMLPIPIGKELFKFASDGNLAGVRRIMKALSAISEFKRREIINWADHWRERDYKGSGFVSEWLWFDLTPLAIAALKGHHDIAKILLEAGADPTLRGCPSDDVHLDAFQAAERGGEKLQQEAGADVASLGRAKACTTLLDAAKPFWSKASYCSDHYPGRKEFTNSCDDLPGLIAALRVLPEMSETRSASADLPKGQTSDANIKTFSGADKTAQKSPSLCTGLRAARRSLPELVESRSALADLPEGLTSDAKRKTAPDPDKTDLKCTCCNAKKPIQSFSSNQRKQKRAATRKCIACIENQKVQSGKAGKLGDLVSPDGFFEAKKQEIEDISIDHPAGEITFTISTVHYKYLVTPALASDVWNNMQKCSKIKVKSATSKGSHYMIERLLIVA